MELTLTTPALLFPALSLLMLAYTNRFLVIAGLIRSLHSKYQENQDETIMGQIKNLRRRVVLIRDMQIFGVGSLFVCVFCMYLLFAGETLWGKVTFGLSLILLMISLGISLKEIQISVNALNLQLSDLEEREKDR